ncbi:MAG: hypothetical protein JHD14_08185, partial [Ilumatobacteraceae bacterium]|nr:hypothetical protein [Ilumatobacteraceae bacterium]
MKKLFHVLIAGVLVLSITGCGKSETSETPETPETPRTRNGAMALLGGLATNSLALIPPIPGMPPELATILGFGGEKDTAILDAIAAIETHLLKIDAKLDVISNQIQNVQSGVDATIGLVNFVIRQNNCNAVDQKYAQLLPLTVAITQQWKILFGGKGNAGLLKSILARFKNAANDNTPGNDEFAFTTSETQVLKDAKGILLRASIDTAIETLGAVLLSSGNSPGLIVSAKNCQTNRFLSSSDSKKNSAIITGFQILLEKAATLAAWSKAYGETNFPVSGFNNILLEFESLNFKLEVMKAMQIPNGQVLDRQTNKMWARGTDNVRLVNAMNGCPDASVDNTYRWMSPSGEAITDRLRCLTSTAIDMPMTDKTEWRLPAIYEMSQPATKRVNWQGQSGFPDSLPDTPVIILDALFKNWKS